MNTNGRRVVLSVRGVVLAGLLGMAAAVAACKGEEPPATPSNAPGEMEMDAGEMPPGEMADAGMEMMDAAMPQR